MKIDVEGAEAEVISGLKNTLADFVDHAVVEITPAWIGENGVNTLFTLMAEAGFIGHELLKDGSPGKKLASSDLTSQTEVLFLKT